MTKEEVLEEAKRIYTIGTEFTPAHTASSSDIVKIEEGDYIDWMKDAIEYSYKYITLYDKDGIEKDSKPNQYTSVIAHLGETEVSWAKIQVEGINNELENARKIIYGD